MSVKPPKILVSGDVNGQFDQLIKRVSAVDKKVRSFGCTGPSDSGTVGIFGRSSNIHPHSSGLSFKWARNFLKGNLCGTLGRCVV